jgi:hypothetical protein
MGRSTLTAASNSERHRQSARLTINQSAFGKDKTMSTVNSNTEDFDSYMDVSNRFAEWLGRIEGNDGHKSSRIAALALIGASVQYLYGNFGPDEIKRALDNAQRSVESAVHMECNPEHPGNSAEVH